MRKGMAQSNNAPVVMYKGKILDKAEPGKLLVVKHSGGEYHVSKHEAPAVKPEPAKPEPAKPEPAAPLVKKTASKRKTGVKTTYYPIG
jgi:hypothetical protein